MLGDWTIVVIIQTVWTYWMVTSVCVRKGSLEMELIVMVGFVSGPTYSEYLFQEFNLLIFFVFLASMCTIPTAIVSRSTTPPLDRL